MSLIESINQELADFGFKIEDNVYTYERSFYHNMIINGVRHTQEEKQTIKMVYVGDSCELDEEKNIIPGTEMCGFDIRDDLDMSIATVFIKNLDDLKYYINL